MRTEDYRHLKPALISHFKEKGLEDLQNHSAITGIPLRIICAFLMEEGMWVRACWELSEELREFYGDEE